MTATVDTLVGESTRPPEVPHLDGLRAVFTRLAEHIDDVSTGPVLVDRMTALAALRNSVDAALAATEVSFARRHAADQTADGDVDHIDPEQLERSIGTQIGLAHRASPTVGRNRMRTVRDLHDGLDHVRGRYAAGDIDDYRVSIIVRGADHLDTGERGEVDRRLADHDIARLSVGRLRDLVRRIAAEVAPAKFQDRCRAARAGRRVTLRQAADGMVDLRAHLPVEQGVACYAALHQRFHAAQIDPAPLTRSRAQVMADILVERLTGTATAEHVDVEVQVMVPIEALLDQDSPLPAEVPGLGPAPVAFLARTRGRKLLRRLLTRAGVVVGGDSQSRCFPSGLADLIRARDRNRCTAPYCDALARQIDHTVRSADGGTTDFANGAAMCELHNYLREQPGWWVEPTPDGTRTTTPTGHTHDSHP